MQLEVGDIILGTVDRILGTIVFVKIEGHGEGSLVFSEVAPGRIRNIRDYVVPKKTIACKILRISGDRIDLSLRRVTQKERKEVMDQFKQEKSSKSILKSVLKEKTEKAIEEIKKEGKIYDFLQESKENPKKLEKIIEKTDAKKILDILNTQKQKKAIIKKQMNLSTKESNGLEIIKKILEKAKGSEIKYISAGKYSISTEDENMKKADNKLKTILEDIEKSAKKSNAEFSVK